MMLSEVYPSTYEGKVVLVCKAYPLFVAVILQRDRLCAIVNHLYRCFQVMMSQCMSGMANGFGDGRGDGSREQLCVNTIVIRFFKGCCIDVTIVGERDRPHRKFKKGVRTRRMWSQHEEEILAVMLVELVSLGWKSDNGFRSGYLQKCEGSIRQESPKTDHKGTPHIVSKITSWKYSYSSLRNILERSGVRFSVNGDCKIDIDNDQWEQVVHVDNGVGFWITRDNQA